MQRYILQCSADISLDTAPEHIAVLPLGAVNSSKGKFLVDAESLAEMKRQIAQKGVELVVDYEHQTLKGVQAPAAGWVKELYLKDGSIRARVEWTAAAAAYLKNKEYRYLSPVISVRKSDGKAIGLHSIALTNTPAIEGMVPIVNSDTFEEGEQNMDLTKQLAALLGMEEGADEAAILEALAACLEENKTLKESKLQAPVGGQVANKAVCTLLGLKADADSASVAAKIMELKSGTIDGVNLVQELQALKRKSAEREAEEAVTLALHAGKLTPAQRTWAQDYALSDPKGFSSFIEKAPQVVPQGELLPDTRLALKNDQQDEQTLLVCKQLGLSAEDLKTYGKER